MARSRKVRCIGVEICKFLKNKWIKKMNFLRFPLIITLFGCLFVCVKCVSWNPLDLVCHFSECCNDEYVRSDVETLDEVLTEKLYGQKIAHHTIINALRGHLYSSNPPKALSMSFHGTPGVGKTYIAHLIASHLYKNGIKSEYYHFFNGRNDFPLEREVGKYREELSNIITSSLQKCERSMFVFDEVDKMPEGVLDAVVPFLDYHPWHKSWRYFYNKPINTKKAIYIFLSNTGSTEIIKRLLVLWEQGKQRDETKLQDFEDLISVGAFNEKGGFHHSETIESSVIDHYVPFLPLEEVHVRKCATKAFRDRNVNPTYEMIEEAMSYVTFGPKSHKIYASAGCKRLEQKVASIIYYRKHQNRKTEL